MAVRAAILHTAGSAEAAAYFAECLQSLDQMQEHLSESLMCRFMDAYLAHKLADIAQAPSAAGKAQQWQQLLAACTAAHSAGIRATAAPTALLKAAWHVPDVGISAKGLQAIAAAGLARSEAPELQREAALHCVHAALSTGDAAQARSLLQQHAALAFSSNSSTAAADWRSVCLQALISAAAPDLALDRPAQLRLIEAALAAVLTVDGASPLPLGPPCAARDPTAALQLARARLLEALGRESEAQALLQAAAAATTTDADSNSSSSSAEQRADALCALGALACRQQDTAAAHSHYTAALALVPQHRAAHGGLGWAALCAGDAPRALPLLEAAAATSTTATSTTSTAAATAGAAASEACYRLGLCYWLLGGHYRSDRGLCFAALLRAAKADAAAAAPAFALLGRWYSEQSSSAADEQRARGCYVRALKLEPALAAAGVPLVRLYVANGQEALAMEQCRGQ
jgi:tetratricopeptide (TPR) repeat protein